ncbi:hypothetical protein CHH49_18140, partial [Terribacillus saccharophilus]|uniref:hypothetical protein n=1 Tax=Terribacillus saccharophilus TaxID=361277 RepID=UPI000BA723AB
MGVIGDAFGKLFKLIWQVVLWIADFFKMIFQNLVDIIIGFFEVIYGLIAGLLYLLYMIGVLAVKLFLLLLEAGQLLWSLVVGFTRTLGSLSYSASGSGGNGYSEMIGKVLDSLPSSFQIAPFAYIALFIIWFTT